MKHVSKGLSQPKPSLCPHVVHEGLDVSPGFAHDRRVLAAREVKLANGVDEKGESWVGDDTYLSL